MAANTIIRLPDAFLQGHMKLISAEQECITPAPPASCRSTQSALPCNIVTPSVDKAQLYSHNEVDSAKTDQSVSQFCSRLHTTDGQTEHKGHPRITCNLFSLISNCCAAFSNAPSHAV